MEVYRLSGATFYDCINTILCTFIKPFLDNKMSIFEEYGAFKSKVFQQANFNELSKQKKKKTNQKTSE